jgi:thioredoxin 1
MQAWDGRAMGFIREYVANEPRRQEVDRLAGAALLEFGNSWCGHCRRAGPLIEEAFVNHARVRHFRISDASSRRLGRSFGVKLWPTLVFLRDGKEVSRLVRPDDAAAILRAFEEIDPNAQESPERERSDRQEG